MSEVNFQNDPLEYARKYSELPLSEIACLELKYIPALIKQYVKGTITLDYGCGPGQTTPYLKSLGLNAEGVDINPHMIEIARQTDPLGKYELIKSGELSRSDNHYHFVYCSWVFVHVKTKDELKKICKEIARVLKNGGVFMLIGNSDETYDEDKEWLMMDTGFEQNKNKSSGSIVAAKFKANNFMVYDYYWTQEDYFEVLMEAGLTVLETVKVLGTKDDGYDWINETQTPFVTIYVAKKL